MLTRVKIAALSIGSVLAAGGLVGGGTYALFSASSSNTNNTFTAGTLSITSERDDIPQTGPMFYTDSTANLPGVVPTGLWAPGDKHTRGLFLENTGSLTGQLTTLTATPADSSGNSVTSGSAYNNDITFAKQAQVTIWEMVPVNSNGDDDNWNPTESSTTLENAVDTVNGLYQEFAGSGISGLQLLQSVNQGLLKKINNISAVTSSGQTVTTDSVRVVNMVQEPLVDFLNNGINVSNITITNSSGTTSQFSDVIHPGEATLLAYTVGFDLRPPAGSGLDPNSMQGKSVYFNFGSNWVQTRHNQ